MKKEYKIFGISIFSAAIFISFFSYIMLVNYKASVTETAFSLCADIIESDSISDKKSEQIINILTFADIPNKTKQALSNAVKYNSEDLDAISEQLKYFDYSYSNLNKLCDIIDNTKTEINAFTITKNMSAEELAENLMKDIFGTASNFKTKKNISKNITKRYYCSNVCVDAYKNGIVKYMSCFNDMPGRDPFIKWLEKGGKLNITESEIFDGIEIRKAESNGFSCRLLINTENEHVFAAEITIYSS